MGRTMSRMALDLCRLSLSAITELEKNTLATTKGVTYIKHVSFHIPFSIFEARDARRGPHSLPAAGRRGSGTLKAAWARRFTTADELRSAAPSLSSGKRAE